jgi:hypothetical protein
MFELMMRREAPVQRQVPESPPLSERTPGPALAAALDELDLATMSQHDLVEAMIACQRQVASEEARLLTVLAEFARRRPCTFNPDDPDGRQRLEPKVSEFAADEVAAALGMWRVTAAHRLLLAVSLAERLPRTLEALRLGRLDGYKAKVIADETEMLSPAAATAVEAHVLVRVGDQAPSALRAACRRAAISADPVAADRRHEAARKQRQVNVNALPDGLAELRWTDVADRVVAFSAALDVLARTAKQQALPGDERSMDQRRADALAEIGQRLLDAPGLSGGQRSAPQVSVVVPVGTLLGVSEEGGELAGYGPIPPAMAREIAAEGVWRRLLTDPSSGAVLDVGRERYRPTAAIRDFVLARDQTCQGVGCRVPARRCDLDHTVDWAHGGRTAAAGMAPLCRHQHRLKHEGGWRVRRDHDALIWTSPTAHTYRRRPDPIPGATPPLPLTDEQLERVREHALSLGLELPDQDQSPELIDVPEQDVPSAQDVARPEEPEPPPF